MLDFVVKFSGGWHKRRSLVLTVGPVSQQPGPFSPVRPGRPFGRPHTEVDIVFQMTDSQQATLTISAADKRGNPVPGALADVAWSTDTPAVLGLTPSADGQSCVITAAGPIGTATVTVNATNPDGSAATGTLAVTIVPGAASTITVTPGAPTEQP